MKLYKKYFHLYLDNTYVGCKPPSSVIFDNGLSRGDLILKPKFRYIMQKEKSNKSKKLNCKHLFCIIILVKLRFFNEHHSSVICVRS